MEIAVAERLELTDDEGALEGLVRWRIAAAARGGFGGEPGQRRHVERLRHRAGRRDVVCVGVVENLEAALPELWRERIRDAVFRLEGAIGAVAVEDDPVDVAPRR